MSLLSLFNALLYLLSATVFGIIGYEIGVANILPIHLDPFIASVAGGLIGIRVIL